MTDHNRNEKFAYLPASLPTVSYHPGQIKAGDLKLFGSEAIVLFYKDFQSAYAYSDIGYLEYSSGLAKVLGQGEVEVRFERMED